MHTYIRRIPYQAQQNKLKIDLDVFDNFSYSFNEFYEMNGFLEKDRDLKS